MARCGDSAVGSAMPESSLTLLLTRKAEIKTVKNSAIQGFNSFLFQP
ncbi:hypothetical protein SynA1560_02011 [Synechococcus sp. A15-60]|nr:hypothetical protein SynA1560_02011 [Synechococcus sp. A15-60]